MLLVENCSKSEITEMISNFGRPDKHKELQAVASEAGQLKRTVSQLKLSWPSVKIYQTVTKTIRIQNASNQKLPLRVKTQGAGFSVSPSENLQMVSFTRSKNV